MATPTETHEDMPSDHLPQSASQSPGTRRGKRRRSTPVSPPATPSPASITDELEPPSNATFPVLSTDESGTPTDAPPATESSSTACEGVPRKKLKFFTRSAKRKTSKQMEEAHKRRNDPTPPPAVLHPRIHTLRRLERSKLTPTAGQGTPSKKKLNSGRNTDSDTRPTKRQRT